MQEQENNKLNQPVFPKENPFKVPDGYFDRFPSRMSDRIADEKITFKFPFPSLLKPAPIIAFASIAVFIGIYTLNVFRTNSNTLTDEEVSTYVYQEGIIDEVELDEIIEYSEIAIADTITIKENESNEIERYLLDEDIDLNDIINEL
jgi:hypothetical protein